VDPKIFDMTRSDPRYPYEAYEFLSEAVEYTQEMLGRAPLEEEDAETDHHVTGEELVRGAVELAIVEFGMMAPVVFRQWGIRDTDDVGNIVFNLIEANKLSRSDRDDITDFHALFDLDKALAEGFVMTAPTGKPGKGSR